MKDFFMGGFNVDLVMLYYDSRMCQESCSKRNSNQLLCNANQKKIGEYSMQCDKLIETYTNFVNKLRAHTDDKGQHLRFYYFDLGKNSHHLYEIGKQSPFIRIYKLGKFDNFVDHMIPNDLSNFDNDLTHFLLDTTTEDLNLHELDEEIDM